MFEDRSFLHFFWACRSKRQMLPPTLTHEQKTVSDFYWLNTPLLHLPLVSTVSRLNGSRGPSSQLTRSRAPFIVLTALWGARGTQRAADLALPSASPRLRWPKIVVAPRAAPRASIRDQSLHVITLVLVTRTSFWPENCALLNILPPCGGGTSRFASFPFYQ